MQKSRGATNQEKAANFWIKDEVDEKALSTTIEKIKATYAEFKDIKMICTAMAYLQRFYLKESIFIYGIEGLSYACLFLAQKVEEMSYTHEYFCRIMK